jgi:hypothetical protein
MFSVGTKLLFKHNLQPAYEKVGEDLWVCLYGKYLVKEKHLNEKTGEMEDIDVSYPESDLPLLRKDGSLNRSGFKWSDEMVTKFYSDIMIFSGTELV